jgi:cardiolipin synthase
MKAELLERIYGGRFITGNRVTVLYAENDAFRNMFEAIEKAKKTVCLVFYIFKNDSTGRELGQLLKKKAGEGLNICVLYDHFGSLLTPQGFWKELMNSGVAVKASRPFKWNSARNYVRRDHRKLVIIDGEIAYTGGLNIADEYRGYAFIKRKKGWRDTAVKIEGPCAFRLHQIFLDTWYFWKGTVSSLIPAEDIGHFDNGVSIMPIFSSSAKGRRKMRKLIYWCVQNSAKSICLTTAYFTPSKMMLRIFGDAVKRGVSVRLLIPSKSDIMAAQYAGRFFFTRLLKSGVEIYEYQDAVLHAKSYVFDEIFSIVGSANLDYLSMRRNDEGNIGAYSEKFAREMINIFADDLRKSKKIELMQWLNRPLAGKFKEWFFSVFRRRL